MNKEYYIYIYFDPSRDMEPFYVGKGKGKRAQYHLSRTDRSPFVNRLKHMKNLGVKPIIEKFENLEDREALDLEIDLITAIGRKDLGLGPLLNLTDGGDGAAGMILSHETREKISERLKGNKFWVGKTHSEDTKIKMSISRKGKQNSLGRVLSDETKRKIGDGNKGKELSDEVKEKISAKMSGELNPMFGKTHSIEFKEKMSAKAKNRVISPETGAKISAANKGRKNSAETKELMRKSAEKRNLILHTCPHCMKEMTIQNLKKYHLDKCKFKENNLVII